MTAQQVLCTKYNFQTPQHVGSAALSNELFQPIFVSQARDVPLALHFFNSHAPFDYKNSETLSCVCVCNLVIAESLFPTKVGKRKLSNYFYIILYIKILFSCYQSTVLVSCNHQGR